MESSDSARRAWATAAATLLRLTSMSGVLHPVGPEEPSTYWMRRLLVIGALVLVVLIVVFALTRGDGTRQAVPPQGNPAASPRAKTPTPAESPSPTSPSPSNSANSSSTSASSSSSPSPSPSATPKAKSTPTATKPPPPVCDPDDLRQTLLGDRTIKAEQKVTFKLSLINGGARNCRLELHSDNFELRIFSGADRIWSTNDCAKKVKDIDEVVGSEKSVEWTIEWGGKRSRGECKTRPELPLPGTYVATAQYEGAESSKFTMTLR